MAISYNGLIPKAKLTMFDVKKRGERSMNVPSLSNIALPTAYSAGVRVHSNSWGTVGTSGYTAMALDVDDFMFKHSDFLFVAAAGNAGDMGMDSIVSPGVSKNALTIGASSQNHDYIVYFSGIGTNFEGPIKPDVIGPGTDLWSAGVGKGDDEESCNIQISSGTSMATPIIAAAAIMVKEYMESPLHWGKYCNQTYFSCQHILSSSTLKPPISAALLKALLVHSATDMKKILSSYFSAIPTTNLTEPPDRFQGWGQVILQNVLPSLVTNFDLYVADHVEIQSLTRFSLSIIVQNNSVPLKATIVWNDPPNVVYVSSPPPAHAFFTHDSTIDGLPRIF
jgi:hypothetical protein